MINSQQTEMIQNEWKIYEITKNITSMRQKICNISFSHKICYVYILLSLLKQNTQIQIQTSTRTETKSKTASLLYGLKSYTIYILWVKVFFFHFFG